MKLQGMIKSPNRYYNGTELTLSMNNRYYPSLLQLGEEVMVSIKDFERTIRLIWELIEIYADEEGMDYDLYMKFFRTLDRELTGEGLTWRGCW